MTLTDPATLDARVATALGHQVLGMWWAQPDHDSPAWFPCPEGREHADRRPLMASGWCHCSDDNMAQSPLANTLYGFTRFEGHLPHCTTVVPRYSTDPVAMMEVLEWLRRNAEGGVQLGMASHHPSVLGRCWCRVGAIEDDTFGDTLMECVALKAVEWAERNNIVE